MQLEYRLNEARLQLETVQHENPFSACCRIWLMITVRKASIRSKLLHRSTITQAQIKHIVAQGNSIRSILLHRPCNYECLRRTVAIEAKHVNHDENCKMISKSVEKNVLQNEHCERAYTAIYAAGMQGQCS